VLTGFVAYLGPLVHLDHNSIILFPSYDELLLCLSVLITYQVLLKMGFLVGLPHTHNHLVAAVDSMIAFP
jgi:hypothetical protein